MRFWISGPRIGFFRPGVSFGGAGRHLRAQRQFARPVGDFVYVIESANNTVKVGISTNPEARLATLQTGSGVPLSLSYVASCQRAFDVEQRAHEILAKHRLSGEWFDCAVSVAVAAIHAAAYEIGAPMNAPASIVGGRPPFAETVLLGALYFAIVLFALAAILVFSKARAQDAKNNCASGQDRMSLSCYNKSGAPPAAEELVEAPNSPAEADAAEGATHEALKASPPTDGDGECQAFEFLKAGKNNLCGTEMRMIKTPANGQVGIIMGGYVDGQDAGMSFYGTSPDNDRHLNVDSVYASAASGYRKLNQSASGYCIITDSANKKLLICNAQTRDGWFYGSYLVDSITFYMDRQSESDNSSDDDSRPFDDFKTGHCKSARCFARHPGGTFVYPNHYGSRRDLE